MERNALAEKRKTSLVFWLVIAAVAVVSVIVVLLRILNGGLKNTVNIYVADELYASYPVSVPRTVTIDQGEGHVNVITIDGSGVVMTSSTCENQICVNTGRLAANADDGDDLLESFGNWIICLPNRVSVELTEGE